MYRKPIFSYRVPNLSKEKQKFPKFPPKVPKLNKSKPKIHIEGWRNYK
jgi:hypothetical protein